MRLKKADKEDVEHGVDAAGLGVLAANPALNMAKHLPAGTRMGNLASRAVESGVGQKILAHEHGLDVAGLGVMAAPAAYHFGSKLLHRGEPKTASIPSPVLAFFFKEAAALCAE